MTDRRTRARGAGQQAPTVRNRPQGIDGLAAPTGPVKVRRTDTEPRASARRATSLGRALVSDDATAFPTPSGARCGRVGRPLQFHVKRPAVDARPNDRPGCLVPCPAVLTSGCPQDHGSGQDLDAPRLSAARAGRLPVSACPSSPTASPHASSLAPRRTVNPVRENPDDPQRAGRSRQQHSAPGSDSPADPGVPQEVCGRRLDRRRERVCRIRQEDRDLTPRRPEDRVSAHRTTETRNKRIRRHRALTDGPRTTRTQQPTRSGPTDTQRSVVSNCASAQPELIAAIRHVTYLGHHVRT